MPTQNVFLKLVNSYEGEHEIKYQEHIPNSIGAKLINVLMIDLLYLLLFLKVKILLINLAHGF